jgi:enoyl-CoA hydratase
VTETALIERRDRIAIARLNRPEALNALNTAVMHELTGKLAALDADPAVGCFILTGSEKAFAAGADIKEMADLNFAEVYAADWFAGWERLAALRTPIIAAVSGFALGGGCEIALMCDMIIAADTAKFGQPEIKLGVIPGMGGSQRLTRAIGKAKASDLILTGRMMDAAEAERCGLAARVVPADKLMDEAISAAETIASYGKLAAIAAKEAIGRSFETPLDEGLRFERRLINALFSTDDKKEGMNAFIEKRQPAFRGR